MDYRTDDEYYQEVEKERERVERDSHGLSEQGHCLTGSVCEDSGHRIHELTPLADALTIHVRGLTDARIVDTGGRVYNVEATLGSWRINADEYGWSLTDANGYTVAIGGWHADNYVLTLDEDTGALVPDECDGAAVSFASAYFGMIGLTR